MHLLKTPRALSRRGLTMPTVMVLDPGDPVPQNGLPYIYGDDDDHVLMFRLFLPVLQKKYDFFDWEEVYKELTGLRYEPLSAFKRLGDCDDDKLGTAYDLESLDAEETQKMCESFDVDDADELQELFQELDGSQGSGDADMTMSFTTEDSDAGQQGSVAMEAGENEGGEDTKGGQTKGGQTARHRNEGNSEATDDDDEGRGFGSSVPHVESITIEEMAGDLSTGVDLNVLLELGMIPAFYAEVAEAIRVNTTDNYQWQDGYNKKTGVCTGYLVEAPRKRALMIVDISWSIPEGVSAGLLTLVKTLTEITHADLIITGGRSKFFDYEEVRKLDLDAVRKEIYRSNESVMFRKILQEQNMDYDVVIAFGDSDNPGEINVRDIGQKVNVRKFYSMFTGEYDRYGSSHIHGAGYGRWVMDTCPQAEVIHNYKWAKFFTVD